MKKLFSLLTPSLVGRVGVGLLLCIVISSCKEIQPVTMGGLENQRLISLSKEGVEFECSMRIKNPNNFAIMVFPSEFDGSVNGINVGKVNMDKKVKIKANSDEMSTFHIKSDFSKLSVLDMASILPVIASKKADVSLKGDLKAGKFLYKKKFPVDLKKTISFSK